MPVYMLDKSLEFPEPSHAGASGLVAVGGDLCTQRLILAYSKGIFPWFTEDQPILWFSPDPRMILYPEKFKPGRSLLKLIRKNIFEVRFDHDFEAVISNCAVIGRKGQESTWITPDMIDAYTELHKKGLAHSVETYHNGVLVGGLYGVSLGGAFFGESMFFKMSNASKVALYYLVRKCVKLQFDFIDSQVPTVHMKNMGAQDISRERFLDLLNKTMNRDSVKGSWNGYRTKDS